MVKKSQNQTWNACYWYLHIRIKVTNMHYLHHIFNKFEAENQMYEVT